VLVSLSVAPAKATPKTSVPHIMEDMEDIGRLLTTGVRQGRTGAGYLAGARNVKIVTKD